MTMNRIRSHLVTGSLMTMLLLPAGVVIPESRITPKSDFDVLAFWDLPSVSPDPSKAATGTDRWFRNTFVLYRNEGTRPVDPTGGSSSKAEPAKTKAAVPAVPVPGTVQNLRWAEKP